MNDTCTNSSINPRVELFQLIMYTPTFILGLLFNVMALSFLFFPAKKLSESTVYLIALIFLDTSPGISMSLQSKLPTCSSFLIIAGFYARIIFPLH